MLDKLFHRRSSSELRPSALAINNAEIIDHAYAVALSAQEGRGSVLSDVSLLPSSKATIKWAIITLLKTSVDPQSRRVLRRRYVMLARFQEGLGYRRYGVADELGGWGDLQPMVAQSLAEGAALLDELNELFPRGSGT